MKSKRLMYILRKSLYKGHSRRKWYSSSNLEQTGHFRSFLGITFGLCHLSISIADLWDVLIYSYTLVWIHSSGVPVWYWTLQGERWYWLCLRGGLSLLWGRHQVLVMLIFILCMYHFLFSNTSNSFFITSGSCEETCYGHKSSTGTVRRLFYQKSYDSTAPVRCPAGGRKNRTIFYHFFRHRTVPGEV